MCNIIWKKSDYRPSAYFVANDGITDLCTVYIIACFFLMLKGCILMILINQLELIETGTGVSVSLRMGRGWGWAPVFLQLTRFWQGGGVWHETCNSCMYVRCRQGFAVQRVEKCRNSWQPGTNLLVLAACLLMGLHAMVDLCTYPKLCILSACYIIDLDGVCIYFRSMWLLALWSSMWMDALFNQCRPVMSTNEILVTYMHLFIWETFFNTRGAYLTTSSPYFMVSYSSSFTDQSKL